MEIIAVDVEGIWQDGPEDAEGLLASSGCYGCHKGVIYPLDPAHVETELERMAIDYLCDEWDWAYSETDPR